MPLRTAPTVCSTPPHLSHGKGRTRCGRAGNKNGQRKTEPKCNDEYQLQLLLLLLYVTGHITHTPRTRDHDMSRAVYEQCECVRVCVL